MTDGNILILKSAFKDVTLRKIYKEIFSNSKKISKDTKMKEGIKNIFYKSNSSVKEIIQLMIILGIFFRGIKINLD